MSDKPSPPRDGWAAARAAKARARELQGYIPPVPKYRTDPSLAALAAAMTKLADAMTVLARFVVERDARPALAQQGPRPDAIKSMSTASLAAMAEQFAMDEAEAVVAPQRSESAMPPGEPDPPPVEDETEEGPYDLASELAAMQEEDETPPPPPDEWETWRKRLNLFHANRLWLPAWGPRPGQAGCGAPHEMLNGGR